LQAWIIPGAQMLADPAATTSRSDANCRDAMARAGTVSTSERGPSKPSTVAPQANAAAELESLRGGQPHARAGSLGNTTRTSRRLASTRVATAGAIVARGAVVPHPAAAITATVHRSRISLIKPLDDRPGSRITAARAVLAARKPLL
jgi:hypothetical protein